MNTNIYSYQNVWVISRQPNTSKLILQLISVIIMMLLAKLVIII